MQPSGTPKNSGLSVLAPPHLYSAPSSTPRCYVGVHVAINVPSDDEGVADAPQQLALVCAHVGCAVVQAGDLQGHTTAAEGLFVLVQDAALWAVMCAIVQSVGVLHMT
jgi:hypothetical protein